MGPIGVGVQWRTLTELSVKNVRGFELIIILSWGGATKEAEAMPTVSTTRLKERTEPMRDEISKEKHPDMSKASRYLSLSIQEVPIPKSI